MALTQPSRAKKHEQNKTGQMTIKQYMRYVNFQPFKASLDCMRARQATVNACRLPDRKLQENDAEQTQAKHGTAEASTGACSAHGWLIAWPQKPYVRSMSQCDFAVANDVRTLHARLRGHICVATGSEAILHDFPVNQHYECIFGVLANVFMLKYAS